MTAGENTKSSGGDGTYISTKANEAMMQHGHLLNILWDCDPLAKGVDYVRPNTGPGLY